MSGKGGISVPYLCDHHPRELVSLYCEQHDSVQCRRCVDERDPDCKMIAIQQAALNFKTGPRYLQLNSKIQRLKQEIVRSENKIDDVANWVENSSKTNEEHVQECEDSLQLYAKKWFDKIENNIGKRTVESKTLLGNLSLETEETLKELARVRSRLGGSDFTDEELNKRIQEAQEEIGHIRDNLGRIRAHSTIPKYELKPGRLVADTGCIGTVHTVTYTDKTCNTAEGLHKSTLGAVGTNEKRGDSHKTKELRLKIPKPSKAAEEKASHSTISDSDSKRVCLSWRPCIDAKSSEDRRECLITSVVLLSDDKLLVTDYANAVIKAFELSTNRLVAELSLPGKPWNACVIPNNHVAITLPENQTIQTVSTGGQLSAVQQITVHGHCRGIAFFDQQFVVGCQQPSKVELIGEDGQLKSSVSYDGQGKVHFDKPNYISVCVNDRRHVKIFVSDYGTKSITMMDKNLNILKVFTGLTLCEPCGVDASIPGELLVVYRMSNFIHRLDTSTGVTTIIQNTDKHKDYRQEMHNQILDPLDVSFCAATQRLYVVNGDVVSRRYVYVFSVEQV